MLILSFEEFNNKFGIDNKAKSSIRIEETSKDISLTPIEIVMREESPNSVNDTNFNIIVNLHPTDCTHWVLFIRGDGGPVYFFDSFGVEVPTFFLEENVDLGSNERIQQFRDFFWWCLLFDISY